MRWLLQGSPCYHFAGGKPQFLIKKMVLLTWYICQVNSQHTCFQKGVLVLLKCVTCNILARKVNASIKNAPAEYLLQILSLIQNQDSTFGFGYLLIFKAFLLKLINRPRNIMSNFVLRKYNEKLRSLKGLCLLDCIAQLINN